MTEENKKALIRALRIWRRDLAQEIPNLMSEKARIERKLAEAHSCADYAASQLEQLDAL